MTNWRPGEKIFKKGVDNRGGVWYHILTERKEIKKMSKLYKCPTCDYHCPYFCHQDKEGEGDYGLCLMQEMEGCSPVNECEAFYGIEEEDFEV